ncbi:ATP-binding protein [Melittangium boletus]|uniref:ATP-binding protein n=1 Tax=Melittangium boletus TaxID=83453 RepID=UPI003DA4A849
MGRVPHGRGPPAPGARRAPAGLARAPRHAARGGPAVRVLRGGAHRGGLHPRGPAARPVLPPLTPPEAGHPEELGLFIVEQIVRAHGGRIQVRSTPREGTRFMLHLPRHPPSPFSPPGEHRP